jgi:hypothetical protein
VARFNQGLALHAAMCERLRASIAHGERERARLEQRLRAELARTDRAAAAQTALAREAAVRELAELEERHHAAEADYRDLLVSRGQAVGVARGRLDALKRNIDEHAMARAMADLSELAGHLHLEAAAGDGTLERLEVGLRERREIAIGRIRVARDSGGFGAPARHVEDAELALARFEAGRDAPGS